jgi:Tol biopolymer transport system component/DNA-binding winged helix-turn-helix (wHTH) protein
LEEYSSRIVRFGVFEVDLDVRELRKHGLFLKLQDQPFQVLALLLERPGEVVTREELQHAIWPEDTFVEYDHGLNTSIQKIRTALGDSASNPRFIETVPRRGYRLICQVETGDGTAPASILRPWHWAGVAAVSIFLILVGRELFRPGSLRQNVVSARNLVESGSSSLALRLTPLTSSIEPEWLTGWSPDGRFIALSRPNEGSYDIFVMPGGRGKQVRVTDSPADDFHARWSPDGRWLAYLSNDGAGENVYLVPPGGGPRRKVAETGIPYLQRLDASILAFGANPWSRDGKELLFSRLQANGRIALWKVRVDTGQETQITDPPPSQEDFLGSWSPDGKSIVFVRSHAKKLGLWILTGESGIPQSLLVDEFRYAYPAWTSDNNRVVFESDRAGSVDLWDITLKTRSLRQLTNGPGAERRPIVSKQGKLAFTDHRQQTDLYWRNLADGSDTRLTSQSHRNYQPSLSPDGSRIIFQSDRSGNFDVWMQNITTRELTQITEHPANDQAPEWSPDGRQIAFVSDRDGRQRIWIGRSQAGAPARPLADRVVPIGDERGTGIIAGPKWSPDGRFIGCIASSDAGPALWMIDTQTLHANPVLDGVSDFGWYKDSRHVIYTPTEQEKGASTRVMVIDLRTKQSGTLLEQPHAEIAVARDGSSMTFVAGSSHSEKSLWLLRLTEPNDRAGLPVPDGSPERLIDGGGIWHAHNGGFSFDGKSVVYMRDTVLADIYLVEGYR